MKLSEVSIKYFYSCSGMMFLLLNEGFGLFFNHIQPQNINLDTVLEF